MFCKKCGKKLDDHARVCSQCGTPVEMPPVAPGNPNGQSGPAPGMPGNQNGYSGRQPNLAAGGSAPPPFQPGQMPDMEDETSSKGSKVIVGILIAAIAAVLAIGAAFFLWTRFSGSGNRGTEVTTEVEETEETLETEAEEGSGMETQATLPEEPAEESESQGEESLAGMLSDSELARAIATYNAQGDSTASIQVFAENFTPGTRNTSYAWDKNLFYTLEDISPTSASDGLINGYNIARKMLRNAETGNVMEYEIYTNPATGKVNKIVSIEYINDYLEITDYYYDDYGKVSFIFVRNDINYIPSYAVPTKDGQRFYYNNDCMVKWRVVSNGVQANYVIGPESARQGDNPPSSIIQYSSLDAGAQSTYDITEKRMINAAYNTYHTVLTAEGISEITGYVYDQQGNPISGARTVLVSETDSEELYEANTDEAGMYRIVVPSDNRRYRLSVTSEGCVPATVYGIEINGQVLSDYQDAVYMVARSDQSFPISVQMYDALNFAQDGSGMQRLSNAAIYIRDGVNHRDGGVVAQATADEMGVVSMDLPPGMYTAEVVKQGYDNTYYNFAARTGIDIIRINASPKLAEGEVRIVLTWGQTPSDLDSHLFTPYDSAFGDNTYHIWYGNKSDAMGNNLDVDDTDSYGPETMTIPVLRNGLYKYYVADFTNCIRDNPTSYEMSYSGAMVNVYTSNGLTATFTVPANTPGVIWEVFEIRNGSIVPIQRYYSNISDKSWWHNDK